MLIQSIASAATEGERMSVSAQLILALKRNPGIHIAKWARALGLPDEQEWDRLRLVEQFEKKYSTRRSISPAPRSRPKREKTDRPKGDKKINAEYYKTSDNVRHDLLAFLAAFKTKTGNNDLSFRDLPVSAPNISVRCANGYEYDWSSYIQLAIYHIPRFEHVPGRSFGLEIITRREALAKLLAIAGIEDD